MQAELCNTEKLIAGLKEDVESINKILRIRNNTMAFVQDKGWFPTPYTGAGK